MTDEETIICMCLWYTMYTTIVGVYLIFLFFEFDNHIISYASLRRCKSEKRKWFFHSTGIIAIEQWDYMTDHSVLTRKIEFNTSAHVPNSFQPLNRLQLHFGIFFFFLWMKFRNSLALTHSPAQRIWIFWIKVIIIYHCVVCSAFLLVSSGCDWKKSAIRKWRTMKNRNMLSSGSLRWPKCSWRATYVVMLIEFSFPCTHRTGRGAGLI